MHKIKLVIEREYIARVKKKSFIIMTLLGPVLFGGFMAATAWMATREGENKVIQVIDESGLFEGKLENTSTTTYQFLTADLETTKEQLNESDEIFALLYIPKLDLNKEQVIKLYSTKSPGLELVRGLNRKMKNTIEDIKLINSGLDKEVIAELSAKIDLQTISLSETGDESESNTGILSGIGYASAMMLYMFIFIYGAQIMRGIIEEKTSRVIEVMISSVRPFQLMVGKIMGIAAVGLTQFVLWIILSGAVMMGITAVTASTLTNDDQVTQAMNMAGDVSEEDMQKIQEQSGFSINTVLDQVNVPLIIGCFLFYFLAGYLFYGSLFAAVGSAVDSDADSQQFMMPITLPLIFSIMMISVVMNDPHGTLAFWLSIVPFSAPIIMMMRIPFDVPTWELLLSMFMMIIGFAGTTWIASRIYRIGIFMHGTKVNFKTLAKWFVMKD